MNIQSLLLHVEALVFASDVPLDVDKIQTYLNKAFAYLSEDIGKEEIEQALQGIQEKYDSEFYPFQIIQSGGGWQFLSKPAYHSTIATMNKDKFLRKLSTASLETLAIIAYKQPVSKYDIETIRGVNSDYSVQKLLEKELIIISGRREDLPGQPLLYATSSQFMDYFGINSAKELPQISEVMAEQLDTFSGQSSEE